jgi:hypothetical protein
MIADFIGKIPKIFQKYWTDLAQQNSYKTADYTDENGCGARGAPTAFFPLRCLCFLL